MCTHDFCSSLHLSLEVPRNKEFLRSSWWVLVWLPPLMECWNHRTQKTVVLISKICTDCRVNQEMEVFLPIPQEESSAPFHIFFIASLRTEDHTSPIYFKILPVTRVFNQSIIVVKIMSEHKWCFTNRCSY